MAWLQTNWRFVTSTGVQVSSGRLWQFSSSGGAFYVENSQSRNRLELTYTLIGGGTGRGIPIAIEASQADFPSGPVGNIQGLNRSHLNREDFEGVCTVLLLQGSAGVRGRGSPLLFSRERVGAGGSFAVVQFGLPRYWLAQLMLGVAGGIVGAFTSKPKARGALWSMTGGLTHGASAMMYLGYVTALG